MEGPSLHAQGSDLSSGKSSDTCTWLVSLACRYLLNMSPKRPADHREVCLACQRGKKKITVRRNADPFHFFRRNPRAMNRLNTSCRPWQAETQQPEAEGCSPGAVLANERLEPRRVKTLKWRERLRARSSFPSCCPASQALQLQKPARLCCELATIYFC